MTALPKIELLFQQALTEQQQLRLEDAVNIYRQVLEIDPRHYLAWNNLGNALGELARFDEALACHEAAIKICPDHFSLHHNGGLCFYKAGRFEAALKRFNHARTLKPDHADARWNRALTLLHLGRFQEGWEEFEGRWNTGRLRTIPYAKPQWQGEDFKGKTLLLCSEQGFGDMILASRFIPLVKKKGGRVVLECEQPLHRLFVNIEGVDRIVNLDHMDEPFDIQIPLMGLPRIFGTNLDNIPPPVKMSVPDQLPPDAAKLIESAGNRFKVGIVWSGRPAFRGNKERAVSANRFLPLADIPDVQLFSLQKGPGENDLQGIDGGHAILPLGPHLKDFADTAAVIKHLDLIIMTDTAVVHLAGTMGIPVWNLLNYVPYWLYLEQREDTPWYPSMRLFRQPSHGDWDSVFFTVTEELKKAIARNQTGKRL